MVYGINPRSAHDFQFSWNFESHVQQCTSEGV